MPEFCSKCGNMVADGVERCPACGAKMGPRGVIDEETGFTWGDLFSYSFVAILFGLAALIIPVLIIWLIVSLYH